MNRHPFIFLLGGILALMIAMGIGRFAYTPILPLMQEDLGFSDSLAGSLASSNYLGYLVGAIIASFLPFHNHKIKYLRSSLLVSIITTLMMGLVHSYVLMHIIRFVSGLASAFIFILTSSIVLDRLANANKTNLAGYFYSGVGLGIFFSTLFVPLFNHSFHWKGVWIGLAIISFLLMIFVWLWLNDSPNIEKKQIQQQIYLQTPPRKWLPFLTIAYGLEGLGYIVTGTFIVSIADQTRLFSSEPAIVWIVVGFAAIPSCVLWSELAKKRGFVRSLVLAMILQAIGIALPVFWLSQVSFILSALLFGATFMGITTLATTLGRQISPSNSNRIIAYLTVSYGFGQVVGPLISGILNDFTQSYHVALIGAASVIFLGSLLLISGIRYEPFSKIGATYSK